MNNQTEGCRTDEGSNGDGIKLYKKRWLVLALLVCNIVIIAVQLMEYNIVAAVILRYYNTTITAIEWSSLVASLQYVIFVIPASYTSHRLGIRRTVMVGSIGIVVGTCIKAGSIHPDRFWVAILGQTFAASFIVWLFPMLSRVAAAWFGIHEIATASTIGAIGVQIAIAISNIISPLVIKGSLEEIERGLFILNISYASISALICLIIILWFPDGPPLPPSIAQQNFYKKKEENAESFYKTFKSVLLNKNFVIFIIIVGVNIAASSPFQILSNQIILEEYKDGAYHVGILGAMFTTCNVVGAMTGSVLLDKFKRFRLTVYVIHAACILSIILYSAILTYGIHFAYISTFIMGLFIGSLMSVNVDVVLELTYPQSQNVAVGLSTTVINIFILVMTSAYAPLFRSIGFRYTNIILIAIIFIVDLLFLFLKFDLRRQAAQLNIKDINKPMAIPQIH